MKRHIVALFATLLLTQAGLAQAAGTFTDSRDGQTYKTFSFKNPQTGATVIWMAQNLNYKVQGSYVLWASGGHPHPQLKRVKPGDGTSVTEVPGKSHSKQKRSVSIALFLTQNLFVASRIDLSVLSVVSLLQLQRAVLPGRCAWFVCPSHTTLL